MGAAAGGLLGAAVLPVAAAFADYNISPDPGSTEEVTGIYGSGIAGAYATPPAVPGSIQGDQLFDFHDAATGATGTFDAYENTLMGVNEEVLVTSDVSGTGAPPVGSVFDTYTVDGSDIENIYSAIPSASGANVISDTLTTPFGNYTIPVTFDAADLPVVDASGVPLGDGVDFVPGSALTLTAITGIPPLFMAIQGDQLFNVNDAAGTSVGSFNADETPTTDFVGTQTEAVLVTSDVSGTAGTAAGDVPPVGSVFNTIEFDGLESFYSYIPTASGGDVSDTLVTPLGDFTIPAMNAAAAEAPVSVDLHDGYDIVADPSSTETLTGINGLAPLNVAIQAQGEFNLESGGAVVGTFNADQTTTVDLFGDTTQTLLVTSDGSTGTVGTAAGELPPVGSVIETVSVGRFENIYTDFASTTPGGDVFSDTLVTPFGDLTIPVTTDLAAGLAADSFLNLLP